jgi:hypothetical protein
MPLYLLLESTILIIFDKLRSINIIKNEGLITKIIKFLTLSSYNTVYRNLQRK